MRKNGPMYTIPNSVKRAFLGLCPHCHKPLEITCVVPVEGSIGIKAINWETRGRKKNWRRKRAVS